MTDFRPEIGPFQRTFAAELGGTTPRHRRDDRDLVVGPHLRLQPRTEANVLVVQVYVHELAQLPVLVQKPVAESRVAGVQGLDRGGQVRRLDRHGDLPVRQAPQWSGDSKLSHGRYI